ncbi:MAG TPA: crossover junction endodeoxyribonuclease RuvC [Syntrophorhabdales bacterium]|nr:crossover junction endodeoxyribonuclease RuvC [Syntrophorhabdales bacterium]
MVILGIDPGLANTGFGAIACGHESLSVSRCGSIKTLPRHHVSHRLFQIHSDLNQLMAAVKPEVIAVENIFSMVRYPKAGILLGGVMAIIYLAAFEHDTAVVEVSPREVKNALAAYGGATKAQIKEATKRALGMDELKSFHVADALAVALTVFYRRYRGRSDIIPGRNAKKDILR